MTDWKFRILIFSISFILFNCMYWIGFYRGKQTGCKEACKHHINQLKIIKIEKPRIEWKFVDVDK